MRPDTDISIDPAGPGLPRWAGPLVLGIAVLLLLAAAVELLLPPPTLEEHLEANRDALIEAGAVTPGRPLATAAQEPASRVSPLARARHDLHVGVRQGLDQGLPAAVQPGPRVLPGAPRPCEAAGPACAAASEAVRALGQWLGQLHLACAMPPARLEDEFWPRQAALAGALRERLLASPLDGRVVEQLVTEAAPRSGERMDRQLLCRWQAHVLAG